MPIDSFTGKYRFLSNFHACSMIVDSIMYPTLEHAFQAAKTHNTGLKMQIAGLSNPAEAKKFGRVVVGKPVTGWGLHRVTVMRELLRMKFNKQGFKDALLATGDEELIEGNNWGDKFWGQVDGVGENMLGKLLMEIRSELRQDAGAINLKPKD